MIAPVDSNTPKLLVVAAAFGWFFPPGYVIAVGAIYKAAMVYAEVNALGGGTSIVGEPESLANSVIDFAAITAGALLGRYIREKTT